MTTREHAGGHAGQLYLWRLGARRRAVPPDRLGHQRPPGALAAVALLEIEELSIGARVRFCALLDRFCVPRGCTPCTAILHRNAAWLLVTHQRRIRTRASRSVRRGQKLYWNRALRRLACPRWPSRFLRSPQTYSAPIDMLRIGIY